MFPSSLKSRISHNLKRMRKSAGLTQFQLAEKAGLSPDSINSIEEKRMWASDKTLEKICCALDIDAFNLLLPQVKEIVLETEILDELRKVVEKAIELEISKLLSKPFH